MLGDASLGLDAQGRAAVLADGVVLAITTDGAVRPVAQDPRLTALTTVEGGLVQRGDNGALLRVDLPLGLPQPQAARTRLPALVTRRSAVASTTTMAIAQVTTTAAGGAFSAMPISAQTTAAV